MLRLDIARALAPSARAIQLSGLIPPVDIVLTALRLAISLVLLASGAAKLWTGPERFAATIGAFRILPRPIVPAAARTIPALEIVIALWVLSGLHVAIASLAAAGLLGIFTGAVAIAVRRGQHNNCGCGGLLGNGPISNALIKRNVGLIVALGFVALPQIVGGGL